jgi:hypothetical protein
MFSVQNIVFFCTKEYIVLYRGINSFVQRNNNVPLCFDKWFQTYIFVFLISLKKNRNDNK